MAPKRINMHVPSGKKWRGMQKSCLVVMWMALVGNLADRMMPRALRPAHRWRQYKTHGHRTALSQISVAAVPKIETAPPNDSRQQFTTLTKRTSSKQNDKDLPTMRSQSTAAGCAWCVDKAKRGWRAKRGTSILGIKFSIRFPFPTQLGWQKGIFNSAGKRAGASTLEVEFSGLNSSALELDIV